MIHWLLSVWSHYEEKLLYSQILRKLPLLYFRRTENIEEINSSNKRKKRTLDGSFKVSVWKDKQELDVLKLITCKHSMPICCLLHTNTLQQTLEQHTTADVTNLYGQHFSTAFESVNPNNQNVKENKMSLTSRMKTDLTSYSKELLFHEHAWSGDWTAIIYSARLKKRLHF